MVRLVFAYSLRRQVAVYLPVRSGVGEAVAARAAGLADAAHEPLLGCEVGVVDGLVCLLVLQLVVLHFLGKSTVSGLAPSRRSRRSRRNRRA